jgi:hypothetical protein
VYWGLVKAQCMQSATKNRPAAAAPASGAALAQGKKLPAHRSRHDGVGQKLEGCCESACVALQELFQTSAMGAAAPSVSSEGSQE